MSNKRLQGMVSEGHILFVIAFPEEGKEGDEYLRILNEIVITFPDIWLLLKLTKRGKNYIFVIIATTDT